MRLSSGRPHAHIHPRPRPQAVTCRQHLVGCDREMELPERPASWLTALPAVRCSGSLGPPPSSTPSIRGRRLPARARAMRVRESPVVLASAPQERGPPRGRIHRRIRALRSLSFTYFSRLRRRHLLHLRRQLPTRMSAAPSVGPSCAALAPRVLRSAAGCCEPPDPPPPGSAADAAVPPLRPLVRRLLHQHLPSP
jgi:hypothetical protein